MTYAHEITGDAQALANGELWNLVSKTDPSQTKSVSKGARKFTAIDAYAQIKRATELFGPVGEGWGWTVKDIKFWSEGTAANVCIVHITLWWLPTWNEAKPNQSNPFEHARREFDAVGVNVLSREPRGKDYISVDDDCAKKALTDAITKGLSYLGFNADVFFGAFDDNKYVADLAREQAERAQPLAQQQTQQRPQETQAAQPAQTQAGPAKRADGKPGWFDELVAGEGKFKDRTWEWVTQGGVDGGRHKWLRAVYGMYKGEVLLKRCSWILAKFYDDQEAKEGVLLSGAQKSSVPEGEAEKDQGWQPAPD